MLSIRDRLRRIPIKFRGGLHGVELVQFGLDPEEARRTLPQPLVPRIINGRSIISIVNVELHHMRPVFLPPLLNFRYRHIAFRMLVDDSRIDPEGRTRGIFFVRSFTNRKLIALGGDLMTFYRLSFATIQKGESWRIDEGDNSLTYRLSSYSSPTLAGATFESWDDARRLIGSLDRAYAVDADGGCWVTKILRPDWPIEPVSIEHFSTDFFKTARPECAFRVPCVIPYTWLPVRKIS